MAARRRPENLTAYDFCLRAIQQSSLTTREGLAEAIRLAHRALQLDPQFGFVAGLAGVCHMTMSFWAMLSILISSARKQFGFLAWH